MPIIQRAQVQFARNPSAAIAVILAVNAGYKSVIPYDAPLARYAVRVMLADGIISNGGDRTLGNFDPDRIAKLIAILKPILASQRKPINPNLRPDDLVTNAYIDPSIGLPTSR